MPNTLKKNIFVVDDDMMSARMLNLQLTRDGINTVKIFNTGEARLEALSENPDIIILDFYLNSVSKNAANGMQILQSIRKQDRRIHVIMLSSQESYATALITITKGAEQYVIKGKSAFDEIDEIIKGLK